MKCWFAAGFKNLFLIGRKVGVICHRLRKKIIINQRCWMHEGRAESDIANILVSLFWFVVEFELAARIRVVICDLCKCLRHLLI